MIEFFVNWCCFERIPTTLLSLCNHSSLKTLKTPSFNVLSVLYNCVYIQVVSLIQDHNEFPSLLFQGCNTFVLFFSQNIVFTLGTLKKSIICSIINVFTFYICKISPRTMFTL